MTPAKTISFFGCLVAYFLLPSWSGLLHARSEFPKTIRIGKGRSLTIPRQPERIVSVNLVTDEILSELVDRSRIQAVTYLAPNPFVSNVSEWAKEIPYKIKDNIEQIVACEPDLVFVSGYTRKETVDLLAGAGLPVVDFDFNTSIDKVEENILKVAEAVGARERAQKMISKMQEKLAQIDLIIKETKNRPKVLSYSPIGYAAGKETTIDEMIVHGGGINVAAENGIVGNQKISMEKLIVINPDIILLSGYYPGKEDFKNQLMNNPSLQHIGAVRNNRIYLIPGRYLGTISQFIVRGVEEVARTLHPEAFVKR